MKRGILGLVALIIAIAVIKFFDVSQNLQHVYSDDSKLPADSTWMKEIKPGEKLLTILIVSDDFIYSYEEQDIKNGRSLNYDNIGSYLREKKASLDSNKLVVIIRRASSASYKNTVDMLDEMTKNRISRYVLADALSSEQELVDRVK